MDAIVIAPTMVPMKKAPGALTPEASSCTGPKEGSGSLVGSRTYRRTFEAVNKRGE